MPGGAFDDPDMRYGFAIDRLFSKRLRRVRKCKCGKPLGVGQLAGRIRCNVCRDPIAKKTDADTGGT